MKINKLLVVAMVFLVSFSFLTLISPQNGSAATNGRMIDDVIFDDSNSMTAADIQNFLNVFPNSCLKNYTDEYPNHFSSYDGNFVSAATVIRRVSDLWGINPKVILTKLEQEENLVSGNTGCDLWRYVSAVGYNCPGPTRETNFRGTPVTTCVQNDNDMGFSRQITKGGWLLKWSKERANDNVNWDPPLDPDDDRTYCYNGPFTNAGNHVQAIGNSNCPNPIYHDGYFQGVDILSGATAALYRYTPFLNQAFDEIYESWFGSTLSDHCIADPGTVIAGVTFRKYQPWIDQGNLVLYSGTSTNCIESHTWNIGVTSWGSNKATNHPIVSPSNAQVHYGDLNGDGVDEPILISLNPTGSGKIEFHVWNRDQNAWVSHIISNAPADNLYNGRITFADVDGDGRDEPIAVLLTGTGSGKVEFHVWDNNMQSWRWHVATQIPTINIADGTVTFADVDGDGVDEPVLIGYRNQSSGMVEFHTWAPGWWSWRFNTASNQSSINPGDGYITFADVDGNGVDEAVLVGLKNTGSGRIEFHTWNIGVTSWRYHTASNQPTF